MDTPGTTTTHRQAVLREEARRLAWYLIGADPTQDVVNRYVTAVEQLASTGQEGSDAGLADFVRKHPWSLPYLDAYTALFRHDDSLRRRLVLFLAIAEATTENFDFFNPRPGSAWKTGARLALWGLGAGLKLLGGTLLYPFARRIRPHAS